MDDERRGIERIRRRIKDEGLIIFPTDKCGKTAIMREDTYRKMAVVHTDKDEEMNWSKVLKVEKFANRHAMAFHKMFKLGENQDQ